MGKEQINFAAGAIIEILKMFELTLSVEVNGDVAYPILIDKNGTKYYFKKCKEV